MLLQMPAGILSSIIGLGAQLAYAQKRVDLFAINAPIVAYVQASDAVATTYLVACPTASDVMECNFNQPYTLIEGPRTMSFQFTAGQGLLPDGPIQSATFACDIQDTTSIACMATGLANDPSTTAPTITTESFTYKGAHATAMFREIPLVTDPASLMTFTIAAPTATTTTAPPVTPMQTST